MRGFTVAEFLLLSGYRSFQKTSGYKIWVSSVKMKGLQQILSGWSKRHGRLSHCFQL